MQKRQKANSKLPFNSRLKKFPLVSCVFFNDMNVTETSFFCEEGLCSVDSLWKRFRMKLVCEEGLEQKQFKSLVCNKTNL